MQNLKVRVEMTRRGMKQKDLAECLKKSEPEISILLSKELSLKEQNEIIAKIKEYKGVK